MSFFAAGMLFLLLFIGYSFLAAIPKEDQEG